MELSEEKQAKVETFEDLEFFQGREERVQSQERAQQPSDRRQKEIWTVGFHVQGVAAGAQAQEEMICTVRSRAKNPSAVGTGEDARSLVSGVCAQEERNWTVGS